MNTKVFKWGALSFLLGMLVLCFSVTAWGTPPVNVDARGVAIRGYDPVAYFTMGKAVQGSQEFAYQWNGATWWFANQDDLEHFKKEPEKYAPRYGGYGAYAVGNGFIAQVDPQAWSIVDGRLYLNFSKDIRAKWKKDVRGYIEKGDRNWPAVLKK